MKKHIVAKKSVLYNFRFWVTLACLASTPFLKASGQTPPQSTATHPPTKQERETWRKSMARTPRPKKGCFEAAYPDTKWREVPCKKAPQKPYPRKGVRPDTVGNGTDFSAQVTGHITSAEGSFDSVTGVTSESVSSGGVSPFSLQLNTNFFSTSTCSTAANPANCLGWEQFIFSNTGSLFIQYWLINYSKACPSGWNPSGSDCFINSNNSTSVPVQPISALADLKVTGTAAAGATEDSVTFSTGTHIYTTQGDNHFPDLSQGWNTAEFNVFGDCCSSQANFNTGSTIVVRTGANSGTMSAPSCVDEGFTGETNNLTMVNTPTAETSEALPSIVFIESNANNPTPSSCATATSTGDTHLRTFDGLLYDFQASGDFVLAKAGTDFVVHTRQASGAPTWPNASVNKAVATQMGNTRVALYIQPTRLVIDGHPNDLADGKTTLLPSGVQVSHHGNVYTIKDTKGDGVRAVLNSTWIDVTVGLARAPHADARGLLGNPGGNAHELALANGAVLKEPVSFTDLYHSFTDSWRVQPNQSLFVQDAAIKAGIPDKPFFAVHLAPQEYARVKAKCTAAGVTSPELIDACALDTAVLNDETAVKVFVHAAPPLHVLKPVLVR